MSIRNLRTEVVTVYIIIAILFMGTSLIDSYFDHHIVRRNGELLQNYEQINQAIVAYNHSSTSFRLYNRNKNLLHYEEYLKTYDEVVQLLTSLSEAFKESEQTVLYSRISLHMLQERHQLIEDYVNYKSNKATLSEDYEWITLMGNYITGFLGDLLSAYLERINQQHSEALSQFNTFQGIVNVLKIAFLLILAFILERIVHKSRQKMREASHVMQEIGKQNFEVEDIRPTSYNDINEFIITTNTMKREIHKLIAQIETFSQQKIEHEQQKRLLAESRFKELQVQINPHFLFNTLSMIIRHIQSDDKQTSIRLVKETSSLLRSSLNNKMTIALDEELELLRSYLFIQQLLLQQRIDLVLDIRRGYGTTTAYVPPLVIQPIVENAVIHGLKDTRSGGLIDIQVVEKQDRFEVTVADNGIGMNPDLLASALQEKEGHVGLHSVYQRLYLLYQREDVMEVQSTPRKGTRVLLRLYKEASLSTPSF
ncbi:MAG: histidine kinase [Sphaerochaetaceae bacterium]|nr:histidine kinase [uncultured Sphaerochaeta sp.]MDC7230190.1 histidine kinase [Sphaerochaetaceae bacterium]